MAYDVFISYSTKNKTAAEAVCITLEERGMRCWIAPRDILPGREWSEAIIEGISECRVMILVFSTHANESQQVRREAERAVAKGAAILPLRIEDVFPSGSMEYYLSTSHWFDALTPPMERHLEHLADVTQALLSGTHTTETLPHGSLVNSLRPQNAAPTTDNTASTIATAPVPPEVTAPSLGGFNWGAFLANRWWLNAHHMRLGFGLGTLLWAPYLGILGGLIFGFRNPWVWLLLAGLVVWLVVGLKGNAWAWKNRRWINPQHFGKVQNRWAVQGAAMWLAIALLGGFFVSSGWNRQVQARVTSLFNQGMKRPEVKILQKEIKQKIDQNTSKARKVPNTQP